MFTLEDTVLGGIIPLGAPLPDGGVQTAWDEGAPLPAPTCPNGLP